MGEGGIVWLTPEEGRVMFDPWARSLLGMSGEEFLRRWDDGEFEEAYRRDGDEDAALVRLAGLIPFGR